MRPACCLAILLICFARLSAQRFAGHPPSLRWQQVNTPAARVIFPRGLDSIADRIAGIAGQLNQSTLPTIGAAKQKINIVLQPYTTISNGYVGLGPYRSEFYLTPAQSSFDLGSLPWHDMLAIHEYRHVQQYNNFDVGLSRAARLLFGQYGQEIANAATIPNWFYEGDAVFQETLVSRQGRGRLPSFFDDYRSLWLAGKNYSWMKLRNGSYLDFTPDHYRLGYMMVAYGREKYGDDFWRKVTHDAAAYDGLFYPFQKAIKKYAGVPFRRFRSDALDYFKHEFSPISANAGESFASQVPDNSRQLAPIRANSRSHFIADQQFPAYTEIQELVYVKSAYNEVPAFIEKGNRGERKIRDRDVSIDNQFSYRNGKIVYASYRIDTRWSWNDYSEVEVLDMATGQQKTITHRSKYFSPDISEDGKTIVAVDARPGKRCRLHLLDANTGALVEELANPENFFYTYPKFVQSNLVVTAVRDTTGQMALALVHPGNGTTELLTPASFRVMGFPVVQHDTVYFTAAGDKADGLYAVTLADKKFYAVSLPAATEGIGVYQPAVSADSISFSTFTAVGYRLQQAAKKQLEWKEVIPELWVRVDHSFGIDVLQHNSAADLLAGVHSSTVPATHYSKTYHLFNFHSLYPYVSDPDYMLSIVGENVLNTMESEVYVAYNRNEQYKQVGADATYGGWFPYIDGGVSYIFDRRNLSALSRPVYWNESQANIGLSIPLNLSKGRMLTSLTAGSDYVYKNVSYTGYYKDSIRGVSFGYLSSYLTFSNQIQAARQHIYPRLAQTLVFTYNRAVQTLDANQALLSGTFYFPGLFLNHNLVMNVAYQQRDTLREYLFSNSFPFSRGYTVPNLHTMFKWGANYHFPLFYPDLGIGNIVYFQRVRANLFYDFTVAEVEYNNGFRINTDFRSYGSEVFFDTKWWNNVPISFGFRYSRLMDPDLYGGRGPNWFEFILPVNLLQR
ncbi:MAG TPA: hypothetical protein VGM41_20075 [Chitinophagaceae bacterium]